MQKEENLTVGQWCGQWFTDNRGKWNGNTEGGYRNLINRHIIPAIGNIKLTDLTEQTVTDFYDTLQSRGLSARSVWCVHLLLRRCMDEAARDQRIPYNPVRLCQEPQTEDYKPLLLRLGQIQRYLNTSEQLGVLPLIYTGLSSGLRQCELITLSWADFHVRYRYILKGQRLLTLNNRAAHLLERVQETDSPYVFHNPKTGVPYKLHEFYYLHKKILKRARLPWVAFRNLQRQCMEVGIWRSVNISPTGRRSTTSHGAGRPPMRHTGTSSRIISSPDWGTYPFLN